MGFKIVQTVENNKKILTIVPSGWAKDGLLFWPKRINELKLIHDQKSVPKKDWKTMTCKIKREYSSLQEANNELNEMQQQSDTENNYTDTDTDDVRPTPTPRPRLRKPINTHALAEIDFNDQIIRENFVECNIPTTSSLPVPCPATVSSSKLHIINDCDEPAIINIPANRTTSAVSIASSSNGSGTNSTSNAIHYEIIDNYPENNQLLIQVYEEQKQIRQQLAVLQASVDFIMSNMRNAVPVNSDNRSEKSFIIKPVSSRQQLQELEEYFKNENNFSRTMDAMTFICGSAGKSRGLDSCYKLIDYFFTRDLLLNCSWTGTSRQNDEGKIALKYFYHTRKAFLTLVRKSDKDFAEQDCDKFFKTIVKNAKQRLNPKIMSATKHRSKKSTAASAQRPLEPLLEQGESNENQVEVQGNEEGVQEQENQAEGQGQAGEQENRAERHEQAAQEET